MGRGVHLTARSHQAIIPQGLPHHHSVHHFTPNLQNPPRGHHLSVAAAKVVCTISDKKHLRTDASSCQIVLTCPASPLAAEGSFQAAGTLQRSRHTAHPKEMLAAPSLCPQVLLPQSPSLGCCSRKPSQSLCPVRCKF